MFELEGDPAAALAAYEDAFHEDPEAWPACAGWARLVALTANDAAERDRALAIVEELLDRTGPEPVLLDSRALLLLQRRRAQEAVDELERAVADAPSPLRLMHLAQAQVAVGELADARRTYESAMRDGLTAERVPASEQDAYEALRAVLEDSR